MSDLSITDVLKKIILKEPLEKLLTPSAQEIGEFAAEKIRLLRFKSSIKTFERAQQMLVEAGLSARPIDLKALIPLLEHCSMEDENSPLIEKWAGLLASLSSEGIERYSYPHILNELSPKEVRLLDEIYNVTENNIPIEERLVRGIKKEHICDAMNISENDFEIIADNLYRLNLCQPAGAAGALVGNSPVAVRGYGIIVITPLGMDFVRVCRGPGKSDQTSDRFVKTESLKQDNVGRFG